MYKKIVILSHWRVGSTNFKKTLEQITGQEFWNEPNFKKHKNTIDSIGFNKFMEKSKWKSMKCDYVKSKDYSDYKISKRFVGVNNCLVLISILPPIFGLVRIFCCHL